MVVVSTAGFLCLFLQPQYQSFQSYLPLRNFFAVLQISRNQKCRQRNQRNHQPTVEYGNINCKISETKQIYGIKAFQTDLFIGASSRDQYARNIPITRDELQSGDLVFFTSPRSGRGVGHVGIVVDVDPINNTFTFIHASTNNGITINSSTDSGYARRYIGARRVQQ